MVRCAVGVGAVAASESRRAGGALVGGGNVGLLHIAVANVAGIGAGQAARAVRDEVRGVGASGTGLGGSEVAVVLGEALGAQRERSWIHKAVGGRVGEERDVGGTSFEVKGCRREGNGQGWDDITG